MEDDKIGLFIDVEFDRDLSCKSKRRYEYLTIEID